MSNPETAAPAIFSPRAKRTIGLALMEWRSIYVQQRNAIPVEDEIQSKLQEHIAYIDNLAFWIHNMPAKDVVDER